MLNLFTTPISLAQWWFAMAFFLCFNFCPDETTLKCPCNTESNWKTVSWNHKKNLREIGAYVRFYETKGETIARSVHCLVFRLHHDNEHRQHAIWQIYKISWTGSKCRKNNRHSAPSHNVPDIFDRVKIWGITRLWVVSNFRDGDCGVGEIHTRARARNFEATRHEGSAENLVETTDKAREFELSAYIPSAKLWLLPFFDTCQQSGNSTQAAVNTRDNIVSDPFQLTEMADGFQPWQIARWIGRKVQNYIRFGWRLFVQSC